MKRVIKESLSALILIVLVVAVLIFFFVAVNAAELIYVSEDRDTCFIKFESDTVGNGHTTRYVREKEIPVAPYYMWFKESGQMMITIEFPTKHTGCKFYDEMGLKPYPEPTHYWPDTVVNNPPPTLQTTGMPKCDTTIKIRKVYKIGEER